MIKRGKGKSKGQKKTARRAAARLNAKIQTGEIVVAASAGQRARTLARTRARESRQPDVGPTKERMAKPDFNDRENRTEDTLARLFRLQRLDDKNKDRNRDLAKAGVIYQQAAYKAGLIGISAQDLLRIPGRDESADPKAVATRKVKRAVELLGVRLASAVHAILVDGHTIEAVGREMTAKTTKQCIFDEGMVSLKNGLSILSEKEAAWA